MFVFFLKWDPCLQIFCIKPTPILHVKFLPLVVGAFLKTIIYQCSKNYGSPTRTTRLDVASNMADPISLNEKSP